MHSLTANAIESQEMKAELNGLETINYISLLESTSKIQMSWEWRQGYWAQHPTYFMR